MIAFGSTGTRLVRSNDEPPGVDPGGLAMSGSGGFVVGIGRPSGRRFHFQSYTKKPKSQYVGGRDSQAYPQISRIPPPPPDGSNFARRRTPSEERTHG